jgi:hypothetical protein
VPPPLPDRYRLQIRLGRDEDVEEWLATDSVLDRPVLVRFLGPDSSPERRSQFLTGVRGAASVTHSHLCAVYAAAPLEQGAYMVGEWPGGVSFAHRLESGDTVPPEEFLANASGLASALAALHAAGMLHGAIDPSTIFYTRAHPAKLGAFGRTPRYGDWAAEVAALADTLEESLTGRPPGLAPPSQLTDGLSSSVDRTLAGARAGALDAPGLATALRAAPTPRRVDRPPSGWSWRWLAPAAILLTVAVGVVSLGLILRAPPGSDFLFPANPVPPSTASAPVITTTGPSPQPGSVTVVSAFAYDPYGDGSEHDDRTGLAHDGRPETFWRTERYLDPLPQMKEGVGVGFQVEGDPLEIEFIASPGTGYVLWWATERRPDLEGWEHIAAGTTGASPARLQLPSRTGGVWLLWFTDLPEREGGYFTDLSEVTFFS